MSPVPWNGPPSWNWRACLAQPQSSKLPDIHRVTPEAAFVLTSDDGYATNLALEDFASPDAIISHSWEGQPLALEHGGPVRLVVPHLYFWKSAKWLRKIGFATRDRPGFRGCPRLSQPRRSLDRRALRLIRRHECRLTQINAARRLARMLPVTAPADWTRRCPCD